MGVETMRSFGGRWRLFSAAVLLLVSLPVMAILSALQIDRATAQSPERLRVSYPVDGTRIPGETIPVVWSVGDGGQVALILDDAIETGGDPIEPGDDVVVSSESPALLNGVAPGQHTVTVVAVDEDGVPVDGSSAVRADVTVTPPQSPAIYPGLCNAIGVESSYDLEPAVLGVEGLEPGDVFPVAEAVQTRSAGIPFATVGALSDTVIQAPLSELLDSAQVISVSAAGLDGLDDAESAACGEIGGIVSDGVLSVGLRQQPSSPLFGIATLISEGDSTRVVIETAISDVPAPESATVLDAGQAPVELPVSLQQGICDNLNPEVVTGLESAVEFSGEIEGVAFATRVLISVTLIEQPVTDLLARAASVTVLASGFDGIADGEVAACGEVGGPLLSGVIRVALTAQADSGIEGFATLFADGEFTTVLVELFRVGGSNQADPSPSPSDEEDIPDTDDDGFPDDVDNCLTEPNEDQADEDGDGIGDACTEEIVAAADADEDGVPDTIDNCTFVANQDQLDSDGNDIGDACDDVVAPTVPPAPQADADADGVPDSIDNCTFVANPGQADSNGDGLGDACTVVVVPPTAVPTTAVPPTVVPPTATTAPPPLDSDGDLIPDGIDNCPDVANPGQTDSDQDGVGDACQVTAPVEPTATTSD